MGQTIGSDEPGKSFVDKLQKDSKEQHPPMSDELRASIGKRRMLMSDGNDANWCETNEENWVEWMPVCEHEYYMKKNSKVVARENYLVGWGAGYHCADSANKPPYYQDRIKRLEALLDKISLISVEADIQWQAFKAGH